MYKAKEYFFNEAKPVWAKGREEEINLFLDFIAVLPKTNNCILNVTGSSAYNVIINNNFISFGPARCAHDYYRVDELDISKYLINEQNTLQIRVAGYNLNSYYLLDQKSFLCAEVLIDGNVIAATGKKGFLCYEVKQKEQKVTRYSYQRVCSEIYDLDRKNVLLSDIVETESKNFIFRNVGYETYERKPFETIVSTGTFVLGNHKDEYKYPRHITLVNDISSTGGIYKGYPLSEVETDCSLLARNIDVLSNVQCDKPYENIQIKKNCFVQYKTKTILTGIIEFDVTCDDNCELIVTFAEILSDGLVNFRRMGTSDVLVFRCKKGTNTFRTFEPYCFGYINIHSSKSDVQISNLKVICFEADEVKKELKNQDEELDKIVKSAINTYRQNTFTIFMDCPGRERAGWLCDSFFTSRVERTLTGKSEIEHNFLENFLLPKSFKYLPKGMLPMCYPGDHYNGTFIPNWAMWFVIELEEYYKRTNDKQFIKDAKEKVYALLKYFNKFENENGLLEKLESWIFIEWSECNKHTQDVNYPTNMLYSYMLKKAGELYQDKELLSKSDKIAKQINKEALIGNFYCDNSKRNESGDLVLSGYITETCQYYAFFTGIANVKTNKKLWETMKNEFGPNRNLEATYPEIYPSNAFIGDYLRLELLFLNGEYDKVIEDIKGYFSIMANLTGTLWENNTTVASCNHGFASHILYWLDQMGYFK